MRTAAIVLAVIFAILTIYYLVPGPYHPFANGDAYATHFKHAVLFAALTVLSLIGARFTASSASR